MVQVLASQAAIQASGLAPEAFSSVCIGNVLSPSSPDAPYLARHVALRCGLPIPTPALIGTSNIQFWGAVTFWWWIRIRGSVPVTNGSGSNSGSDFRDAKKIFCSSYFLFITYPQKHYHQS
jgi:hypothetical protein